ncbi:putative uncharacterized protein [Waddlia chondrophila 2032/99]|uniref:Uncharacterized protein n=2 Tax=Waddlia chondrophila TaxID=71667 RepID=D6YT91_WADCW|nr:hypothetical protein [Waddlia chondrophila]ADI39286.1 hypothetical protein wcw_1953 [Waddlia chondrophila WSU 86-1044]CCB90565.1 putative uncharacterized protein [Waddlia chondrophila 2032/99]
MNLSRYCYLCKYFFFLFLMLTYPLFSSDVRNSNEIQIRNGQLYLNEEPFTVKPVIAP